jgi:hypothetical protein
LAVVRARAIGALAIACIAVACGGSNLFVQYEYEEDVYLSLDGTATVYVNTSLPALNALRGTSFDAGAVVDRTAVRDYFTTPTTHVSRVSPYRRSGRRFVSVRIDVDDIRTLGTTRPFGWSSYRFEPYGEDLRLLQTVGAAAGKNVGNVGWTGREIVAFRLHLPSKIDYNNSGREIGRGNILAWEQPLQARLRSAPLEIEARMQPRSILYSALYLFGMAFVAVAIAFGLLLYWIMRKGGAGPALPAL